MSEKKEACIMLKFDVAPLGRLLTADEGERLRGCLVRRAERFVRALKAQDERKERKAK